MASPADLDTHQLSIGASYIPVSTITSYEPQQPPNIGTAGTGGIESEDYLQRWYLVPLGYRNVLVIMLPAPTNQAPFVELMQEIKAGFGRTMTRLPEVFGVSRQTLYNWLNGETPKPAHHEKLSQLAEAARVFSASGFKPTSFMLDRKVSRGKSLLQLLAEDADGRATAEKLLRIVRRGKESDAVLEQLLGERVRTRHLDASDIGPPVLNEDS